MHNNQHGGRASLFVSRGHRNTYTNKSLWCCSFSHFFLHSWPKSVRRVCWTLHEPIYRLKLIEGKIIPRWKKQENNAVVHKTTARTGRPIFEYAGVLFGTVASTTIGIQWFRKWPLATPSIPGGRTPNHENSWEKRAQKMTKLESTGLFLTHQAPSCQDVKAQQWQKSPLFKHTHTYTHTHTLSTHTAG